MERIKTVRRNANGSVDRVKAEKRRVTSKQADFQESGNGTYSYATQAVWRNPKTGCRILASIGIVVSDGSVMMWVKT
jgi:hypothetical protein